MENNNNIELEYLKKEQPYDEYKKKYKKKVLIIASVVLVVCAVAFVIIYSFIKNSRMRRRDDFVEALHVKNGACWTISIEGYLDLEYDHRDDGCLCATDKKDFAQGVFDYMNYYWDIKNCEVEEAVYFTQSGDYDELSYITTLCAFIFEDKNDADAVYEALTRGIKDDKATFFTGTKTGNRGYKYALGYAEDFAKEGSYKMDAEYGVYLIDRQVIYIDSEHPYGCDDKVVDELCDLFSLINPAKAK